MLGRFSRSLLVLPLLLVFVGTGAAQQEPSKVSLQVSESVFAVLAGVNTCGYDEDLATSDPIRLQIREDIAAAIKKSEAAQSAVREMCLFYRDHQQRDASRTLAQYVSLALNLGDAPLLELQTKESDLPPDASYVLGFRPLVQRFFATAGLHDVWLKHQQAYERYIDKFNEPVAKMILTTDAYLKMPISGYLGRQFIIYVDPLAGPGTVNARNYGDNYYIVLAPERDSIKIEPIRHTYLHFVLDPLTLKRANQLKRLEPILYSVKTAPMSENYKSDVSLLVTESLIRAIEARMLPGKGKDIEKTRAEVSERAATEGFILAPYFNEQLAQFEKSPEGLQDSFPMWLRLIDMGRERKRADEIQFATQAAPDVVSASTQQQPASLLDDAEKRLASGDVERARELAQTALNEKKEDEGRAYFVLGQIAALNKDMNGARSMFEQAVKTSKAPRIIAWANIYLGRMLDMQAYLDPANRERAKQHYRAALEASNLFPGAKAAAERGLKQPYEPPVSPASKAQSPEEEEEEN